MTRPIDRLDLLRLFLRTVETGSISAAARTLGLSQPSASRQLKGLEALLGARLLLRSTHTLALTEEGRALIDRAAALLEAWEGLRESEAPAEPGGLLRVIAPIGLGQTRFVPLLARFRERFPQVTLDWLLTDADVRLIDLAADCVIRVGPVADEGLIVRPLAEVLRIVVAVPSLWREGFHDTPESLSVLPAVVLAPYYGAGLVLRDGSGGDVPVTPSSVLSTDNILAAHEAALAGIGWAALPEWLVADEVATGRLVRLCPTHEAAPLTISIGWAPGRHRPRKLGAFIDFMLTETPTIPGMRLPG